MSWSCSPEVSKQMLRTSLNIFAIKNPPQNPGNMVMDTRRTERTRINTGPRFESHHKYVRKKISAGFVNQQVL